MNTEQKSKPPVPPLEARLDEATWPNTVRTRFELDAALEAAERSGESRRTIAEIIASAKAKYVTRG